jgi:hypothetical protein
VCSAAVTVFGVEDKAQWPADTTGRSRLVQARNTVGGKGGNRWNMWRREFLTAIIADCVHQQRRPQDHSINWQH